MNTKQLGILNALVTFAAEHIPGGLSEDEQEVAQIVGAACLTGAEKKYVYKVINASHHESTEKAANDWAHGGWRVVAAIGSRGPGYADQLVLERHVLDPEEVVTDEVPVQQIHPDYQLIFVGVAEDNEKIALYKSNKHPEELYIRRQNGELWALDPGATTSRHVDIHDQIHIRIYSSQWTGHAVGTMKDLREAQEQ